MTHFIVKEKVYTGSFTKTLAFYIQKIVNLHLQNTVAVAHLVRVSDCGSEGSGFDPHRLPYRSHLERGGFFLP